MNIPPCSSFIYYAHCSVSNNTTSANDSRIAAHRTTPGDLHTVTFNVVKGGVTVIGGTGLRQGDDGKACRAFILGIPA